jgi:hypothetical protein
MAHRHRRSSNESLGSAITRTSVHMSSHQSSRSPEEDVGAHTTASASPAPAEDDVIEARLVVVESTTASAPSGHDEDVVEATAFAKLEEVFIKTLDHGLRSGMCCCRAGKSCTLSFCCLVLPLLACFAVTLLAATVLAVLKMEQIASSRAQVVAETVVIIVLLASAGVCCVCGALILVANVLCHVVSRVRELSLSLSLSHHRVARVEAYQ